MDAIWSFRSAYNEARKVKNAQDAYCAKAQAGLWDEIRGQSFPESLQWEALVDVLRGRVKVGPLSHAYEKPLRGDRSRTIATRPSTWMT